MSAVRPAPMLIMDFDETLVDKDSSEWVAEQLGATPLFDDLRWGQGMPWHQAMNAVLQTLHSQGCTIAHIRQALSRLPLPSETLTVLRAAHSLGCQLHILSDANTFFIEAVLAYHGVDSLFTHIHSNPAWVDAKGCLRYDDFRGDSCPPHNCPLCPPNMCKGSIINAIQTAAAAGDPPIVYAGDGRGDLCPSLRLSERDRVLPRCGYPLETLLSGQKLKPMVHPWISLAAALQESLLDLVENGDLDVPLNLDGLQTSPPSSCVASSLARTSALLVQRDEETGGKGSVVSFASAHHRTVPHFVHKTWRHSAVAPLSYADTWSFHICKNITSIHARTSRLQMSLNSPLRHMHANESQMLQVIVGNTGHPYFAGIVESQFLGEPRALSHVHI